MGNSELRRTALSEDSASNPVPRLYPVVYLAVVGLLLLSFLPLPAFDPSAVSTDFRWRQDLIGLFSMLRFRLGDRVFNKTLVGQDGWLFYSGEQSLADYQHTEAVKRKTLLQFQQELDALDSDLRAHGKTLLVVIVPNKSTIYPQYMPPGLAMLGEESRLEQFTAFMQAHGTTRVIDLRPVLIGQSRSADVYYKTDTHWNELGAYYGATEILNVLSGQYPGMAPFPPSDYMRKDLGMQTRDLPQLMGIPQLKEDSWELARRRNTVQSQGQDLPGGGDSSNLSPAPARPKLLIYHDSFYVALRKFLAYRFSRVKQVPLTQDAAVWNTSWIRKVNPDVVIIELAERYLYYLPPLLENGQ